MNSDLVTASSTLLTPKQLAALIGRSVYTLANWRSPYRGVGPVPTRMGNGKKGGIRVYYRLCDVQKWQESLRREEISQTRENALAEAERVA